MDTFIQRRNWKIYFTWIEGKEYDELAKEFGLTHDTVKTICHNLLPPSVKGKPWQTAHAYRNYREWKRAHMHTTEVSPPTPPASPKVIQTDLF